MTAAKTSVVEQYQGVIRALIPFAARGKLLEGLNKFSNRIPREHLEEIKYEVNRLISPCERSATSKGFAKGALSISKLGNRKLELDSIGRRILRKELENNNQIFTEAVHEALTSETRYVEELRNRAKGNIESLYSVDCPDMTALPPLEDLRVIPPFQVECDELQQGTALTMQELSTQSFTLHTSEKPDLQPGEKLKFTFPPLEGITEAAQSVEYECAEIRPLPGNNSFSMLFKLCKEGKWARDIAKYLISKYHALPLPTKDEEQRSYQALIRDTLVSNVEMQAFLGCSQGDSFIPRYLLAPLGPDSEPPPVISLCKRALQSLTQELKTMPETYQFRFSKRVGDTIEHYAACLRELKKENVLASFINEGQRHGSLRVIRLSMAAAGDEKVKRALLAIKTEKNVSQPELDSVLFAYDVSHELDGFQPFTNELHTSVPEHFRESTNNAKLKLSMPDCFDRRQATRYQLNVTARIKTGWFRSVSGKISDVSEQGLCISLSRPLSRRPAVVSVSCDDLGLRNISYRTVNYDPHARNLHLHVEEKHTARVKQQFFSWLNDRPQHVAEHDIRLQQITLFDYFWTFASSALPGIHILLAEGKEIEEQLVFAYTDGNAKTIAPFKMKDGQLPTHGWFAEAKQTSKRSNKLSEFVKGRCEIQRKLFFVRHQNRRLANLSETLFNEKAQRRQLYEAIKDKKGSMVAHSLLCREYKLLDRFWYKKRCKNLNKVDKLGEKRLHRKEQRCHRILSIVPVSILHQNILLAGEFTPQKQRQKKRDLSAAS